MDEKAYEQFEQDVEEMLGDGIRANDEDAKALWSALANVNWYHPAKNYEVGYSFRAAGRFIDDRIRGNNEEMGYMNWYCQSPDCAISEKIAYSLRKKGWIYDNILSVCDEPGCIEDVSCGTPTDTGYRNTCGKHQPK